MDIIFAMATTEAKVFVESECLNIVYGGKKLRVPIVHERVTDSQDLAHLREVYHTRIDNMFDRMQEHYKEKNPNIKKTVKVFNCFGAEPEMVEIEV